MKSHIATKTISKIILAGLIVSSLPMNLTAKTRRPRTPKKISYPLASWKTQRPSKESIDKAIKDITKLTRRLKRMNLLITAAILGAGGLGVATGVGMTTIALILAGLFPFALISAIGINLFTPIGLGQAIPFIIAGVVTAIISGYMTAGLLTVITGGLTAAQIVTPLARAKTLQNIEKKYPGILTKKQITAIEKLNKVIKGPISKGVVKGIRLKNALKESANLALQKALGLSRKTIQEYLQRRRTARNLQLNINAHKAKIRRKQKERDKHSKWKLSWHKKNLKVLALKANPKYTFLKLRLGWYNNKLKNTRKKHSGIEQKLDAALSNYMQKSDAITAELSREFAK